MSNELISLQDEIKRVLRAINLLAEQDDVEAVAIELRRLYDRLEVAADGKLVAKFEELQHELYSILAKNHYKVHNAVQIAMSEEEVEICEQGLLYYADLQKSRPLSATDLEYLRVVEERYKQCREEYNNLIDQMTKDGIIR